MRAFATWGRTSPAASRPSTLPRHQGHPDPDQVVYIGRDGARVHVSQKTVSSSTAPTACRRSPSPAGPSAESSSPAPSGSHPGPGLGAVQRHRRHLPFPPRRLPGPARRPPLDGQRPPAPDPGVLRHRQRCPPPTGARHRAGQDATPGLRAAPHRPA